MLKQSTVKRNLWENLWTEVNIEQKLVLFYLLIGNLFLLCYFLLPFHFILSVHIVLDFAITQQSENMNTIRNVFFKHKMALLSTEDGQLFMNTDLIHFSGSLFYPWKEGNPHCPHRWGACLEKTVRSHSKEKEEQPPLGGNKPRSVEWNKIVVLVEL